MSQRTLRFALMIVLSSVFGVILLASLIPQPFLAAGWYWDIGNGLGFAAFAGMLLLALDGSQKGGWRRHEVLGYGVLTLVLGHILWFLIGDSITLEYIKFGAPWYMWVGITAALLLFILVFGALSRWRKKLHKSHSLFKQFHYLLSLALYALSLLHIFGSGFYINTWPYMLTFAVVSLLIICFPRINDKVLYHNVAHPIYFLYASLALVGIFATVRNVAAAVLLKLS